MENLHNSVMINEIISFLPLKKSINVIDATFGGGGYSKTILEKFNVNQLLAIDRDPISKIFAKEIAKRINNLDFFSEDYDDFSTSIFSEIVTTNVDKEGRFLIPEELKLYAGIKTEAAFFGQGHFFQIWEPKQGLKNTEDSRRRLLKEKKSLRMMLTQQK